ncbi:MAG: ice-binding family protein [Minisyncoccia bacterium]
MHISKIVSIIAMAASLALPAIAFADSPTTVNLGTAGNYAILAETGISAMGTPSVTGDIGVSPAAASSLTGFTPTLSADGTFSTSALVTGKIYASDYAGSASSTLATAVTDMQSAYIDAVGRAYSAAYNLGSGNISGRVLPPGIYKWRVGVTITSDVTFLGGADDVWILQIPGTLSVSPIVKVVLMGGAQAKNIFWQVGGQANIGANATFNGTILDQSNIVLAAGAQMNGRALTQAAVVLDGGTITTPVPASIPAPIVAETPPVATTTPATPATPAEPTVTPAVPATPATPAARASGLSAAQIQSVLNVLASFGASEATVAKVKASLEGATTSSVTSAAVHTFKENLTIGSLGSEVKALQEFLNAHGYVVATTGAGSPGNETTKFGAATKAALIKYQKAKGITPASGYFGAKTRAAINAEE